MWRDKRKTRSLDWRAFLKPQEAQKVETLERRAVKLDEERHGIAVELAPIRNRAFQRAKKAAT